MRKIYMTNMKWLGVCAMAWMLSGCASSDAEFTVGLALTQDGIRPMASNMASMGGMHIMGEGVPLY